MKNHVLRSFLFLVLALALVVGLVGLVPAKPVYAGTNGQHLIVHTGTGVWFRSLKVDGFNNYATNPYWPNNFNAHWSYNNNGPAWFNTVTAGDGWWWKWNTKLTFTLTDLRGSVCSKTTNVEVPEYQKNSNEFHVWVSC